MDNSCVFLVIFYTMGFLTINQITVFKLLSVPLNIGLFVKQPWLPHLMQ